MPILRALGSSLDTSSMEPGESAWAEYTSNGLGWDTFFALFPFTPQTIAFEMPKDNGRYLYLKLYTVVRRALLEVLHVLLP